MHFGKPNLNFRLLKLSFRLPNFNFRLPNLHFGNQIFQFGIPNFLHHQNWNFDYQIWIWVTKSGFGKAEVKGVFLNWHKFWILAFQVIRMWKPMNSCIIWISNFSLLLFERNISHYFEIYTFEVAIYKVLLYFHFFSRRAL